MLAVAIASAVSRALSYGTIYTTKLLRRGTDIDRSTPWRALSDLKVADAMQPIRPPFTLTHTHDGASVSKGGPAPAAGNKGRGVNGASPVSAPVTATLPGPVTGDHDPQAIFGTESLAQALRQLEVYGRDGLPVLSDDGQQVAGWVTNASVLSAVAREIDSAPEETAGARAAAGAGHDTPESAAAQPPNPLPAYRVVEITLTADSSAAGTRLGDISWPPGHVPVSLLRNRSLHRPDPHTVVRPGDRIALLTPDDS